MNCLVFSGHEINLKPSAKITKLHPLLCTTELMESSSHMIVLTIGSSHDVARMTCSISVRAPHQSRPDETDGSTPGARTKASRRATGHAFQLPARHTPNSWDRNGMPAARMATPRADTRAVQKPRRCASGERPRELGVQIGVSGRSRGRPCDDQEPQLGVRGNEFVHAGRDAALDLVAHDGVADGGRNGDAHERSFALRR